MDRKNLMVKINLGSVIVLLMLSLSVHSQQGNKESAKKGRWMVTNQFGYSTLESENTYKIQSNVFEATLAREFYLSEKFSLITGLETLRVKGDFLSTNNEMLFIFNNHIGVPLSVRFYQNLKSESINVFGDIGFYTNYLLRSKLENVSSGINQIDKNLGINFGAQVILGLNLRIDNNFSMSFGFKYKSDLLTEYGSSEQEFMLTDFYSVQLGIGFTL